MIPKIKQGDTIKCLRCGEPIYLDEDSFVINEDAEYIVCERCGAVADVQNYHRFGTLLEREEE